MKLKIHCSECTFEQDIDPNLSEFQRITVTNDGIYPLVCSRKHKTTTLLQSHAFEVLFQIGMTAIVDGYYREAISSFAASLERFHEFTARVLARTHGTPESTIEETWNEMRSQSERQYGAYLMLWAATFKSAPPMIGRMRPKQIEGNASLKENWTEYRNEVIHKGRIPSYLEATSYGNLVYTHISSMLDALKNRYMEGIQAELSRESHARHTKAIKEYPDFKTSFMAMPTALSWVYDQGQVSFVDALEFVKRNN